MSFWADSVVPLWQFGMPGYRERFEEAGGHFLTFGIVAVVEKSCHFEAGLSGGALNVFHHEVDRPQGMASPFFCDETEEAVFDWIPL